MKRHPLSALFSRYDMDDGNLHLLAEDIKDNGQLLPITIHESMILDGWNRFRACELAGVEPVTMDLAPGLDPWEFVKGVNMLRRHMTPAERVAVMLAKVQMEGGSKLTPSLNSIQKDLDVSRGTAVKASSIVKAHDPALNQALADKKISLDQAADLAKLPEPERHAALENPEPRPRAKDVPAECQSCKDLRERLDELMSESRAQNDEFQAMIRIVDADDQSAALRKELAQALAMNKVLQDRLNGKMTECNQITQDAKRWKRKAEALEKKFKALDKDETFQEGR